MNLFINQLLHELILFNMRMFILIFLKFVLTFLVIL